jgi:hypothetical protein
MNNNELYLSINSTIRANAGGNSSTDSYIYVNGKREQFNLFEFRDRCQKDPDPNVREIGSNGDRIDLMALWLTDKVIQETSKPGATKFEIYPPNNNRICFTITEHTNGTISTNNKTSNNNTDFISLNWFEPHQYPHSPILTRVSNNTQTKMVNWEQNYDKLYQDYITAWKQWDSVPLDDNGDNWTTAIEALKVAGNNLIDFCINNSNIFRQENSQSFFLQENIKSVTDNDTTRYRGLAAILEKAVREKRIHPRDAVNFYNELIDLTNGDEILEEEIFGVKDPLLRNSSGVVEINTDDPRKLTYTGQ